MIQKQDISNDVGKISKDEGENMDVKAVVGNGQPEENRSHVAVQNKAVADRSDEKSQSDITAAKPEEPAREKHDANGSSSPVKRKQVREKSDSESEDHDSPVKKPRNAADVRMSDAEHAVKMSDEDAESSVKPSPKKRKRVKEKADDDEEDAEEELERTYHFTVKFSQHLQNVHFVTLYFHHMLAW